MIVLHVITSLRSPKLSGVLTRVVLADQGPHAARHIVVSLTDNRPFGHALQDAGVEVHCLGPTTLLHMPRVLIGLSLLMQRTRPDIIMSWLYQAHFLGTLAAITSGIGAGRIVWNVPGSNANISKYSRKTRSKLMLLAALSSLPWGIAVRSRSDWQAHQALGFRPRRWFRPYSSARESATEAMLDSYRQLWRFASGVESFPGRPGFLQRRIYPRLENRWAHLRRLLLRNTTFVAVTGSCGKTTTTQLTADILKTDGPCYLQLGCTVFRGSVRTVLSIPTSSKYCVQEVSGFPRGEIVKHSRLLRPRIAIVTTIGSDHYKSFRGPEAAAREKGQLIENLPRRGIAILNADDPNVRAMADRTRARVLLFGVSSDAEIRVTEISSVWPDRLTLTVVFGDERVRIQTKLAGEHWTTSVLAAIACGVVCGIDLKTCAQAVEAIDPVFGRYSVHAKPDGAAYVLDSVKAPLWTIPHGLAFVEHARAPRKTIIFGTISDYPGSRGTTYRRIARKALEVADRVIFVGPNAASVLKLKQEKLPGRLFVFETSYQASRFVAEDTLPKELVYIKGSRKADHLERIMLSQHDEVVCWHERCKREVACQACIYYRKPHPPPFGLAERQSHMAAPSLRT